MSYNRAAGPYGARQVRTFACVHLRAARVATGQRRETGGNASGAGVRARIMGPLQHCSVAQRAVSGGTGECAWEA